MISLLITLTLLISSPSEFYSQTTGQRLNHGVLI